MRWAWLALVVACSGSTPADHGDARGDAPPGCGDGTIAGNEQCDGTNLGGATCGTAVAPGWVGTLGCTSSCEFDVAACNTPQTTYTAGFTTASNWGAFDLSTLSAQAIGYSSSVFDGRYMYFVPNDTSTIARYDTNGTFTDGAAWTLFDLTAVTPGATNYQGGAYDGKYVYIVPYGASGGVALRYDPTNANGFASQASWTTFDITTLNPNAKGFVRAVLDGRYIYYVPFNNGAYHGTTARYDTHGAFGDPSSWQVFDLSTANANAKGYLGGAFDGRYVYYVPYFNGTAYHGLVARFDTQAAAGFADASSWTMFDAATEFAQNVGFYGVAFDGRYLYLPQHYDGVAVPPQYGVYITRYDTQAPFTATSSWTQYAPTSIETYTGAVFDGRYVYFSGYFNGTAYVGTTVAYDTQGAGFGNPASWSVFDASALNASAKGWDGTGFDGEYIYFVPDYNGTVYQGVVARYHAKTPSWEPRGWNRTFE